MLSKYILFVSYLWKEGMGWETVGDVCWRTQYIFASYSEKPVAIRKYITSRKYTVIASWETLFI